jgi:hypothetical protein
VLKIEFEKNAKLSLNNAIAEVVILGVDARFQGKFLG